MIEFRKPYIKIKIANFGILKNWKGIDLDSFYETESYEMLKVDGFQKYKSFVNLWLAGIIILKYTYNLETWLAKKQNWY